MDDLTKAPEFKNKVTHSFKAETKKLLDIVAKSIYTDKEVFLREMMSNCSDALEKQWLYEVSGKSKMTDEALYINVITNEKDWTITIFDSGIGMTKDEIVDNLGTIAKSGSSDFVKSLGENAKAENIIGQFGVGFYSTFIVASSVEVLTKSDSSSKPIRWVSDGNGEFEVYDVSEVNFTRGTQIKLYLTPECWNFSQPWEVEAILKKFSLFITYPIKLNGEVINSMQAIWYWDKWEVSDDEYEKFYENIAKTKIPYKFKLHYATDVPLAIKSVIYFPSTSSEKYSMVQEPIQLHLYSWKVLIK